MKSFTAWNETKANAKALDIAGLKYVIADCTRAGEAAFDLESNGCPVIKDQGYYHDERGIYSAELHKRLGTKSKPKANRLRFPHSCANCIYLGSVTLERGYHELYFCKSDTKFHTLLARFGKEEIEYRSGETGGYDITSPELVVAQAIAKQKGLL